MRILDAFKERYSQIVDDEPAFFDCLMQPLPKSFRVNTLKSNIDNVKKRFAGYGIKLTQMPWYDEAFISDNLEVGSTLEHFHGDIYLQELVSMIPAITIKEELSNARLVLDACAAPGSKTTQMAAIMNNKGTIVANDLSYARIRALRFNLEKTGTINTVITNYDIRRMSKNQFEVILLDVPCSAEGTFRKNSELSKIWTMKQILSNSHLQKQLITKAFDLLAPGGTLVYSTCTFAPEENEEVVNHLLENRDAKIEKIEIPDIHMSWGIEEWNTKQFDPQLKKTVRIWPHHNNTGGFYIAKVTK